MAAQIRADAESPKEHLEHLAASDMIKMTFGGGDACCGL